MTLIKSYSEFYYSILVVLIVLVPVFAVMWFTRHRPFLGHNGLSLSRVSIIGGAVAVAFAQMPDRRLALYDRGLCFYETDGASRFVSWHDVKSVGQETRGSGKGRQTFVTIEPKLCKGPECTIYFPELYVVDVGEALKHELSKASSKPAQPAMRCPANT